MRKLVLVAAVAVIVPCLGCGQFFRASSVTASPDGGAHVFSTKDVYACQVAQTGEPVCTQAAKH